MPRTLKRGRSRKQGKDWIKKYTKRLNDLQEQRANFPDNNDHHCSNKQCSISVIEGNKTKLIHCDSTPPHSPLQEVESQQGRNESNSSSTMNFTTNSEQLSSPKSLATKDTMTQTPNVNKASFSPPKTQPFPNDLSSILYETDNDVSKEENMQIHHEVSDFPLNIDSPQQNLEHQETSNVIDNQEQMNTYPTTDHGIEIASQLSPLEIASQQVMLLLDHSGSSRGTYDQLLTLLRSISKKGIDVTKLMARKSLVTLLQRRYGTPNIHETVSNGLSVFSFSFSEMVQDLLVTCGKDMRRIMGIDNITNKILLQEKTHFNSWETDTL